MGKLFAIAAFLLASTTAQAQITFEYGGKTIKIDPDRGTVSIPGVYDNTPKKPKHSDQDADRQPTPSPDQAKIDPQTPAPAPQTPATAPTTAEPAPANAAPAPTTAAAAPSDTVPAQPPPSPPAAQVVQDPTPAASPAPPAPVVATAPVSAPVQQQQTPAPAPVVQAANTPLGLWLTEEKEGKVRIEQCGANLCGYSVDSKSNKNGEQVLINMKPGKDSKWSGRIFDPKTGSTYDSTIAMKGTDALRVQGCAFGGMFCGGQTWSRLN
jgi:uncharacterized protein (DUF2147 family)